ncbi:hypothetical protein [Shewanella sp.]|uniref:hypothetical protein n=1 Tax=Shewanella sp. TaxID=50422 RepID=UPI001B6D3C9C|nr:hypothetical protein [Shewanella sp.]MBP6517899.1 hypothetical protein [Shewanella sp.]
MAKRIFIAGAVANGNYDSEIMSADYPDLVMPAITFYDALGAMVAPTAGTVKVYVSADGVNFVETKNSKFNAKESYLSTRQLPVFAGLAVKCRITLTGIVGATSFSATIWRGDAEQQIPVTVSANGNERVKVDTANTAFWDAREFRVGIDKTAAYTLKLVSPIDFILQMQTLTSNDGTAVFKAYTSSQVTSETAAFNDTIQNLPNNGMSTAPAYTKQITISGGGTVALNGTPEPREIITVRAATSSSQRTTVGGDAIKERGLPAGTYYLVFTGSDYNYRLIYEERP